jgi:hypothetical protein
MIGAASSALLYHLFCDADNRARVPNIVPPSALRTAGQSLNDALLITDLSVVGVAATNRSSLVFWMKPTLISTHHKKRFLIQAASSVIFTETSRRIPSRR